MSKPSHIVAMGGGGFSMEPDNPLLDSYVLSLATKERPKVCFLPTATGDSQDYIERFYASFRKRHCKPVHLSLFKPPALNIRGFLLSQSVIYVGGGNTRNMMVLWREWGLDKILDEARAKGIVLTGVSAGMICWFNAGVTDSTPPGLSTVKCLGFLPGSGCPHYDGEAERRPSFQRFVSSGELSAGMAADDSVALHFVEGQFHKAVSSHPDKRGFRVMMRNGQVCEEEIVPEYLGGKDILIRRAARQDAHGIHESHVRSIREVCAPFYSPEEVNAWGGRPFNQERVWELIQKNALWVVEDKGVVRGFAHLSMTGENEAREAILHGLYLTPEIKRQGFGKKLLALAEEYAREQKANSMTFGSSLNALDFYKAQGFEATGPVEKMQINGVGIRNVPMKKILRK